MPAVKESQGVKGILEGNAVTHPKFIFLQIMSTPSMEDIVIRHIFLMTKRCHCPNGVL